MIKPCYIVLRPPMAAMLLALGLGCIVFSDVICIHFSGHYLWTAKKKKHRHQKSNQFACYKHLISNWCIS